MSVAALMLVKDEADVIEPVVRHLLAQLDEVYVYDNLSTDGTSAILAQLARETGRVRVEIDREVGYRQSEKTSNLARLAQGRGHSWAVPCDADEVWYSPFGRIADVLEAVAPEFVFVPAALFDHIPTGADDLGDSDPTSRIGWRFANPARLVKVACRLVPGLVIGMGNHEASVPGSISSSGAMPAPILPGQLVVRHFSWRGEDQYLRKIRNGVAAYAASGLPDTYGGHWRMWAGRTDEDVVSHFREWFYVPDPEARVECDDVEARLIYDPAPVSR